VTLTNEVLIRIVPLLTSLGVDEEFDGESGKAATVTRSGF
jgi:hypothetical protein